LNEAFLLYGSDDSLESSSEADRTPDGLKRHLHAIHMSLIKLRIGHGICIPFFCRNLAVRSEMRKFYWFVITRTIVKVLRIDLTLVKLTAKK